MAKVKLFYTKGRRKIIFIINPKPMGLFFIGIIEMLIVTSWTKCVAKSQIIASGVITFLNVLIWYFVLQTVISNIDNLMIVGLYALGCGLGTIISIFIFKNKENKICEKI